MSLYPPNYHFHHHHLIGIKDLSEFDIYHILDHGDFIDQQTSQEYAPLKGKNHINLFFENSTRTQASFELAAKRLGADVLNMSIAHSSVSKGETLMDTVATLNAMQPNSIAIRHSMSGVCNLLSQKLHCHLINAGDGIHEHPTQALLDAYTIRQALGKLSRIIVVICGDILHSRVARSNIVLLNRVGARVKLVGPRTLVPPIFETMGAEIYTSLPKALEGADIIMGLRLQKERMEQNIITSAKDYYSQYGLTQERIQKYAPNAYLLHPGPVNRNTEIESKLVDSPQSLINKQVKNGVIIRAAILDLLSQSKEK